MWRVIVHGGVSDFLPTKTENDKIMKLMNEAKFQAEKILAKGGNCVDAVEEAIRFMENCGEFNAGKGSVMTRDGTIEMDAAIMRGKDLAYGSLGYVKNISNPISSAREIMEGSEELLIVGRGAEKFIKEQTRANKKRKRYSSIYSDLGTVGCVALDKNGNMCSGISSGGAFNKPSGRLGAASVVGAGIYANNSTCAISVSGVGEEFIKHSIANTIHSCIKYGKMTLKEACKEALRILPDESGGIIALDKKGNLIVAHNCKKFYITFGASKY